jgi:hypothetical protein
MTAIRVTARPCLVAAATLGSPVCLALDPVPLIRLFQEADGVRLRLRGWERAAPIEARDTTAARDCPLAPGVGGMAVRADVG